jgi:hypothetical protein
MLWYAHSTKPCNDQLQYGVTPALAKRLGKQPQHVKRASPGRHNRARRGGHRAFGGHEHSALPGYRHCQPLSRAQPSRARPAVHAGRQLAAKSVLLRPAQTAAGRCLFLSVTTLSRRRNRCLGA